MKKFPVIGISLLLALAVVAYVFLADRSSDTEHTSADAPAEEREPASHLPEAETSGGKHLDQRRRLAAEERTPRRRSATKGAHTSFSLTHGEIGYVDVDSIVQDRDPYSVIALLKDHRNRTGAGEWVEIEINYAQENNLWGYEASFTLPLPLRSATPVRR